MPNTFCESTEAITIVKNEKRAPEIIFEEKHISTPTFFSKYKLPYDDWFRITIIFRIDRHLIQREFLKCCIISKPSSYPFQLVYHKDSRKNFVCDVFLFFSESKSELCMSLHNFKPKPKYPNYVWYVHKIILNS